MFHSNLYQILTLGAVNRKTISTASNQARERQWEQENWMEHQIRQERIRHNTSLFLPRYRVDLSEVRLSLVLVSGRDLGHRRHQRYCETMGRLTQDRYRRRRDYPMLLDPIWYRDRRLSQLAERRAPG